MARVLAWSPEAVEDIDAIAAYIERDSPRYGDSFKATAVKLSSLPGVLVQDVAAALDIHPFMLSLWRKQVRDGVIVAKGGK
jgi:transposase-like protein